MPRTHELGHFMPYVAATTVIIFIINVSNKIIVNGVRTINYKPVNRNISSEHWASD
jgi:hypothetical protein